MSPTLQQWVPVTLTLALACCSDGSTASAATALKINGSTTVNPIAAEAAEVLRAELGKIIRIDTQGGSSGGISLLGEGLIQIGMSSRPVSTGDRERFPRVDFVPHHIGEDAVALVVSRDVWEGGVRSLSRTQMRAIYEGQAISWRQVGGPDRRIAFFNKEPGRGTWEVFARWLYGAAGDAPVASWPEVGSNEETRQKVAASSGALSQLSSSWIDGKTVFALALRSGDGPAVAATAENIATRAYPMSRPLYLLTDGPPAGDVSMFVDFVLSPRGQGIVRRHGYLSLDQLAR